MEARWHRLVRHALDRVAIIAGRLSLKMYEQIKPMDAAERDCFDSFAGKDVYFASEGEIEKYEREYADAVFLTDGAQFGRYLNYIKARVA